MEEQQEHYYGDSVGYMDSTPSGTPVHYTAKALAKENNIASATLRNRWYPWLQKVAPEALLKTDDGYTELARTLFSELASVDPAERHAWVVDAKARYSAEWASAGVIEAELMPDSVGGALATLSNQQTSAEIALAAELAGVEELIGSIIEADTNFSEAELATFRTSGAQRGVARFKIETQAELEVLNHLRNKRMQGE